MSIITVCGFAITAVALIAVLKRLRPELAPVAVAAAGVLIFVYLIQSLLPFIEFFRGVAAESGVESYFSIMLKALAVSMCCRMSADICRDCGENSLASRVELAGKVGILLISLPVVKQLLELAKDLMQ